MSKLIATVFSKLASPAVLAAFCLLVFGGTALIVPKQGPLRLDMTARAQTPDPAVVDILKSIGMFPPLMLTKVLKGGTCSTSAGIVTCAYTLTVTYSNSYGDYGNYVGPIKLVDQFYPAIATTVVGATGGWVCSGGSPSGTPVTCEFASANLAMNGTMSFDLTLSFLETDSPAADFNCVKFETPKSSNSRCAHAADGGPPYGLDAHKELKGQNSAADFVVGKPVYFEIKVINKAGVPPGNNQIVVTDEVPDGFTVTSLTYDNLYWTCSPTSGVGPFVITCTHNMTAPLLPPADPNNPDTLPTIEVHGFANKPGAFLNCATAYVPGGNNIHGEYFRHCGMVMALPPESQAQETCLKLETSVCLLPNGTARVTLTQTGPANFATELLELRTDTPGVTIMPPSQAASGATTWILKGVNPGDKVKLYADGVIPGGGSVGDGAVDKCCNAEIEITIPEKPCTGDEEEDDPTVDLKVEKTGWQQAGPHFWYEIKVTNVGDAVAGNSFMLTDTIPSGVTVMTVDATGWNCTQSGSTLTCAYTGSATVATGAVLPSIKLFVASPSLSLPRNCAEAAFTPASGLTDAVPANNKDCFELADKTVVDRVIDLAVDKSVETVVGPMPNMFKFTLKVSNVGSTPVVNASPLKVTDIVPAGMTFTSATGPNWTCGPSFPLAAGATLTCTYTGPTPVAPGAQLPPITIQAAAPGAPQSSFSNCAKLPLAGDWQYDTNDDDNQDCVTIDIRRPPPPAPPPQTCREPEHWNGRICVRCDGDEKWNERRRVCVPACDAPEHWNGRACVRCDGDERWDDSRKRCVEACVEPERWNGRACVRCRPGEQWNARARECRPQEPQRQVCDQRTTNFTPAGCVCRYPFMLQATPTSCLCPPGTNLEPGIGCLPVCREPATLNRAKLACECPKGMEMKNGKCEEEDSGFRFRIVPSIGPARPTPTPDPTPRRDPGPVPRGP